MTKYEYVGTQPFVGTLEGADVALMAGDKIELNEENTVVRSLVLSKRLVEVKAPNNTPPNKVKP